MHIIISLISVHGLKHSLIMEVTMRLITLITTFTFLSLSACSSSPPETLGLTQKGQLHGCPESPNCVSSTATSKDLHTVGPFNYSSSKDEAKQKLIDIIDSLPEAKLVIEEENYIRAEFTSAIFKFVDDVEFHFDIPTIIHVRSASRIGYSDLGVNRKRVEHLRQAFKAP